MHFEYRFNDTDGKLRQKLIENLPKELKRKNHVDDNLIMHMTPMMRQMFASQNEEYDISVFNDKKEFLFDEITYDKLTFEKISDRDYAALPKQYKNSKLVWLKSLGACIIQLVFLIASALVLIFKGSDVDTKTFKALVLIFIVTGLIFTVSYFISMTQRKDEVISPDEEVAVGNAVLFFEEPSHEVEFSYDSYYVGVAFYNEKKFIRMIGCSKEEYNKMELDTQILICNKNAYAIQQLSE